MGRFSINGNVIGLGRAPYTIAEMSGNHNQSFGQAVAITEAAARVGASAIKLQTYTADTITIDSKRKEFLITNKKNLWKNKTLHQLYKKGQTPRSWHKKILII